MTKNISKYLIVITLGVLMQLQFGCSLSKFTASNSNDNSASNSTNSSPSNSKTPSTSDSSSVSATPEVCRNAYYPVSSSVERKYHIKYEKMANLDQDYSEKYTDFTNDGFVAKTQFKDVNTTINWRCLPEGLLATQYGNSIDMRGGNAAKIETISSTGVSFPADSKWAVGEKWTTTYDIKETITNPNGQATGEGNGTVSQDWEIVGAEDVTVPAGTFQTMKVKVKMTLDLKVKIGTMTVPTKTLVETTSWFAKDVGAVKSQSAMGGMDMATTELLSYAGTK